MKYRILIIFLIFSMQAHATSRHVYVYVIETLKYSNEMNAADVKEKSIIYLQCKNIRRPECDSNAVINGNVLLKYTYYASTMHCEVSSNQYTCGFIQETLSDQGHFIDFINTAKPHNQALKAQPSAAGDAASGAP